MLNFDGGGGVPGGRPANLAPIVRESQACQEPKMSARGMWANARVSVSRRVPPLC